MIRPVIDSKFADDVSSRYLYGMSPLLPADMTLLHPEEQEENQGPAPKYETYLQNINQITQNTEENLIVNLKLDFHFLHKMFSKTLPSMTVPKHLQKSFINNPEKVIQEQLSKPEMMRQLEPILKQELAPMVLKNEAQPLEQETATEPKKTVQRQPEKIKPAQKQLERVQRKAEKAQTVLKKEVAPTPAKQETQLSKQETAAEAKRETQRQTAKEDSVQKQQLEQSHPKTEKEQNALKIEKAAGEKENYNDSKEKNAEKKVKAFPKAPDTLHMQPQKKPEDVLLFTQAERVLAQPPQEENAQSSGVQTRLEAAQPQKQKPEMPAHSAEKTTAPRKKQEKAESRKSAQQEKTTVQSPQKLQTAAETQMNSASAVQTIQQRTEERQKMLHFAQQWIKRQKPILEKAAAGKTGESFYPFVRAAMLHRAMEDTPVEQASALAQLQKMTAEKASVAAKQLYLQEPFKSAQQVQNSRKQPQPLNKKQANQAADLSAAQTKFLNKSEPEMQLLQNLVTQNGHTAQQAVQQLIRWDNRFMQPAHKQSGLAKPAEKINHELIEPMQLRYPEGVTSGQIQPQAQEFTSAHREHQKAEQASMPAKMQHLMQEAEQQALPEQKIEAQIANPEKVQFRNGVQAVQMPKPQTRVQTVYRQGKTVPLAPGLQNKAVAALTGTSLFETAKPAAAMQNFVYPESAGTGDRTAAEPMRQLNMSKKSIPPLPMVHKKESQPEKPQENPREEINDIQTIQKVVRATQNETIEKVRAINAPPAIMDPVPMAAQNTTVQINQIADQVYNMLERRLRFENIRKGGF